MPAPETDRPDLDPNPSSIRGPDALQPCACECSPFDIERGKVALGNGSLTFFPTQLDEISTGVPHADIARGCRLLFKKIGAGCFDHQVEGADVPSLRTQSKQARISFENEITVLAVVSTDPPSGME